MKYEELCARGLVVLQTLNDFTIAKYGYIGEHQRRRQYELTELVLSHVDRYMLVPYKAKGKWHVVFNDYHCVLLHK